MIWTAIYENKTYRVFTTETSSLQEDQDKAESLALSPPFAVLKGNQHAHFVERSKGSSTTMIDPFDEYIPNDPRNW